MNSPVASPQSPSPSWEERQGSNIPTTSHAPLWTGEEAIAALSALPSGAPVADVRGISIDTRTLRPGDLFFAIRGESRDGHAFVVDALAKGAAAAVVEASRARALAEAGPLLFVDDVLAALARMGRAARARSDVRVVAVTGSVGKTSTKEALRHGLSAAGPTHASEASYNNHWGVPLTLARMPRDCGFGVFEIGMSAPGEIAPLVGMVAPHVAIVTTVAPVHLEFFPSVEAIADAKAEIFCGLLPGGTAVINRDTPQFERLKAHAAASRAGRIVSFGEHASADVRLRSAELTPDTSIVTAEVFRRPVHFVVGAPGRHLILNSLAMLAAVHAIGADVEAAARSLGALAAPEGRGARSWLRARDGTVLLIDESYNANPASMRAAIEALGQAPVGPGGRRIAALADMLELGPTGPALHAALAHDIEHNGIDLVFAAGPLSKNLYEALPAGRRGHYAEAWHGLEAPIARLLSAGDAVMVKGSKSTLISRLVAALKTTFSAEAADA